MFHSLQMTIKTAATLLILSAGVFSAPQIQAGTIVPCGSTTGICSSDFDVFFMGNNMGGGELLYNEKTGVISLNTQADSITGNGVVTPGGGIMWTTPTDETVSVGSLSGNADPILGFALGATTGAAGATFGFTFNLPIALQGPINADSSVSYSLTSLTAAGAQVAPVVGNNIVSAFEVDTSVGGLSSLNKGVDVGNTFFFVPASFPPAETQNSPVYTASNTFTGNIAYDLMTVKVDFSLSANSTVGMSGFVQQTVVPVPAAVWLFGSGLLGLVAVARRRKAS